MCKPGASSPKGETGAQKSVAKIVNIFCGGRKSSRNSQEVAAKNPLTTTFAQSGK